MHIIMHNLLNIKFESTEILEMLFFFFLSFFFKYLLIYVINKMLLESLTIPLIKIL